jgi:hypothetical protein
MATSEEKVRSFAVRDSTDPRAGGHTRFTPHARRARGATNGFRFAVHLGTRS